MPRNEDCNRDSPGCARHSVPSPSTMLIPDAVRRNTMWNSGATRVASTKSCPPDAKGSASLVMSVLSTLTCQSDARAVNGSRKRERHATARRLLLLRPSSAGASWRLTANVHFLLRADVVVKPDVEDCAHQIMPRWQLWGGGQLGGNQAHRGRVQNERGFR